MGGAHLCVETRITSPTSPPYVPKQLTALFHTQPFFSFFGYYWMRLRILLFLIWIWLNWLVLHFRHIAQTFSHQLHNTTVKWYSEEWMQCMPFLFIRLHMWTSDCCLQPQFQNTNLSKEDSKLLNSAEWHRVGYRKHFNPFVCPSTTTRYMQLIEHWARKVQMQPGA